MSDIIIGTQPEGTREYADGFMLTKVDCVSCKQSWVMNPNLFRTRDELKAQGDAIHKTSQVLCFKPRLVLIYVAAMIDSEIFVTDEEAEQPAGPLIG